MTIRKLRARIKAIRDSLNPKNSQCFGYLNKEVEMLEKLDKELINEKEILE